MKKQMKRLLSVGLCLAIGLSVGSGLVACGDKNNEPDTVPYWLAGKIQGVDSWGDDDGAVADETHRFAKTDTAKVYELTLDLWEGDNFKIRYENEGWSTQYNWDNAFDPAQAEDPDCKFNGNDGYPGEHNITVDVEGNYTLTLDMTGENAKLTYTYNGEATVKAPILVKSIEVNKATLTLQVGGEETLTATITPDNADDKTLTWVSSDTEVATVDENGKVTAVAEGEATITVKGSNKKSATCKVTVVAAGTEIVEVTGVTLSKEAVTLHVGGDETITATVAPEGATNKAVAWASSDEEVATVDENGKITAGFPGTATITVTADGGKTATCEVTVATDYYLRGDVNGWGAVKTLDDENGIYLTETETAGIYKTESIEIKKGAGFQIAIVGGKGNNSPDFDNGWAGAITKVALSDDATTTTYMEKAASGDNINVKARGMYTITLDMTGENPVITCVQDEELEVEVATYYLIGGGVAQGWTTADTTETVASGCLFTDVDGVLTATATLAENGEFKVAIVGSAWTGALGASAVIDNDSHALSTDGDNIKALKAGTFVITVNPDTSKISYTFTAAAAE